LNLTKKFSEDHLPAVEALLVLPCCCCCTTSWSLLKAQAYLINFPYSMICFIIIISTVNKSFFQSFFSLYFTFFSLHPLIYHSCPTIVIIPFFIFKLLLSNCYCLDLGLLLSNRYCLELLLY
jgi:hypothetical protein